MSFPIAVLAGGRSKRMGGRDKCLLPLGDSTVLARIIATMAPQTHRLMINSNGDSALFASTGLPVRGDTLPGRMGPLAGILTAMRWAAEDGDARVVTVAGDMPFLPADLICGLTVCHRPGHSGAVVAASRGDLHPTVGLWPVELAENLERDLLSGMRRLQDWLKTIPFEIANFDCADLQAFENVNTPDQWQRAVIREAKFSLSIP